MKRSAPRWTIGAAAGAGAGADAPGTQHHQENRAAAGASGTQHHHERVEVPPFKAGEYARAESFAQSVEVQRVLKIGEAPKGTEQIVEAPQVLYVDKIAEVLHG